MSKSLFLKIKECIHRLEQHGDEPRVVSEVANHVISDNKFLSSSDEAVNLVNALANLVDGNEISLAHALNGFYCYWGSLLRKSKINLVYVGDNGYAKQLAGNADANVISEMKYFTADGSKALQLSDFVAPVVVYDPYGAKRVESADLSLALEIIPFYDLMFSNRRPTSQVKNAHGAWLEAQYRQAKNPEINTLIVGNSYGYYAFPSEELKQAVNLSMHSLSAKQAHAMVLNALENMPHIKNYIFCFGLFDLYCNPLKSTDSVNKEIIDAFGLFFAENNIDSPSFELKRNAQVFSTLILNQSVPHPNAWTKDDLIDVRQQTAVLIGSEGSFPQAQQDEMAVARGQSHSRLLKHGDVLEENKRLFTELMERLAQQQKSVTWLVPPFPPSYVQSVCSDMKQTNRQFFSRFDCENSRFIDWSENKNFERRDFRDGDHLNFLGARKLVFELRNEGVAV